MKQSEQFIRHLFTLSAKTDFSKPQKQRPLVFRGLVWVKKVNTFMAKCSPGADVTLYEGKCNKIEPFNRFLLTLRKGDLKSVIVLAARE